MGALRACEQNEHRVYWCDVLAEPPHQVAGFLQARIGAAYVNLGKAGADGLMRALYNALVHDSTHKLA